MREIMIKDRTINEGSAPFVIAEIGVNYYDIAKSRRMSPMEAAKLMIDEAVASGMDAVKFQTYKAEKLASKNSPAYWNTDEEPTDSQYKLFKKFDAFGEEEYKELATYCEKVNTIFMSTPFDLDSLEFLAPLMPAIKAASSDITNKPLLRAMASKKKPMIISTGASTVSEIREAIGWVREVDDVDVSLLHCVLSYPTVLEDANLNMISILKHEFPDNMIGYSDHVPPDENMLVLTAAHLLGAKIIEKHFTLDKTLKGNDHYHAMDPADMVKFKNNIKFLNTVIGDAGTRDVLPCELESRKQARRSLVSSQAIGKGEMITEDKLICKRPGTGISPKDMEKIIGKRAVRDIEEDEILTLDMME